MRIDFNAPLSRAGSRRNSTRAVARQHSYDDDIKASTVENVNNKDTGLELPSIPRRYVHANTIIRSLLFAVLFRFFFVIVHIRHLFARSISIFCCLDVFLDLNKNNHKNHK